MTITIAPFMVDAQKAIPVAQEKEVNNLTYWGIYLDDKYISHTSSKEQAEKTKVWIEKWLKDRN